MKHILSLLIGIVIGYFLSVCLYETRKVELPTLLTDTITEIRDTVIRDTFCYPKPYLVKTTTVDTLYAEASAKHVGLPIENKEYKDSNYIAWVSGYRPSLDSIKVFGKTVQVERLRTIRETQIVSDAKKKIYLGVGINRYDKCYTPNVNVYYSKKDFLIGATAGLINSKPIYGINVNYKIK